MGAVSGELTYTSFDAPGALGGWQVKQQRGFADPALLEYVIQRIRTQGLAAPSLPPYPTAEQRAALPRTLVYGRRGGTGVWWHGVAAGADGSGRLGNVFAHVLAVEQDRVPASRPVEWWGSAGWLTPYGPAEVSAAVLAPQPPPPGQVLDRVRVLDWLATGGRSAVLGRLLDGWAEARRRGVPLVVLSADETTAARWVGALSHVLALPQAADLTFSTGETAARVRSGETDELSVVCLSGPEADALGRTPGPVRVDVRDVPDGRSEEPDGSGWARLARSALAEPALLELMDLVVQRVGGTGGDPAWPLAMAHLWYLDGEEAVADPELAGLRDVAVEVVLRGSPDELAGDDGLLRVVSDVLEGLSEDADGAWELLARHLDAPPTVTSRLLAQIHTDRLLADPDALARLQQGRRPRYPAGRWWQQHPPRLEPRRVAGLARSLRTATDRPARHRLAAVLGLAHVLTSTGTRRPDGFDEDLSELLHEVWRSGEGDWLAGIGPVPEPVAVVARAAFDSDEGVRRAPLGTAAPHPVLRWLFPAPGPSQRPRLRSEVEFWLTAPPADRPEPVVLALLRRLRVPEPGTDLDHGRRVLTGLADRPWTARGLVAAEAPELAVVPERRLEALVLGEPGSADLRRLLDGLWRADRLRPLVALRQDALAGGSAALGLDGAVRRVDHAALLRRLAAGPCPPDLLTLAQTVVLDAALRGAALPPETTRLVRAQPGLTPPAQRWLGHRPRRRGEVYRALLTDPRMAADPSPASAAHELRCEDQPALRWWVQTLRLGRDELVGEFTEEYRRTHRRVPDEKVVGAVARSYVSRPGVADLLRRRPWGER